MGILPPHFSCVTNYAFLETRKVIVATSTPVCQIPDLNVLPHLCPSCRTCYLHAKKRNWNLERGQSPALQPPGEPSESRKQYDSSCIQKG